MCNDVPVHVSESFTYYQKDLLANKCNEDILMQILFFAMTETEYFFFYFTSDKV